MARELRMEGVKRGTGYVSLTFAVVLMCVVVVVIVPGVSATRWMVGGNKGWSPGVNYTIWAQDKDFYNGDWLCKLSALSLRLYLCVHALVRA